MDNREKKDVNEETDIKSGDDDNSLTDKHYKIIKYVCSKTNLTEQQAYNALINYKGDYLKVIEIATARHLVGIVMRQTNYTFEEAVVKLHEHKGEPVDVIREFMGTANVKKHTLEAKTPNQMIFNEIRNFMDDVNKGYNARKQISEKIKKMQE